MKINKDYMQIMRSGKLNTQKPYLQIKKDENTAFILVCINFALFVCVLTYLILVK